MKCLKCIKCTRLALLAVATWLLASMGVAGDPHLLIVSGLSGEPRLGDTFHEWAAALKDAARERYGLPASHVVFLAEKPERDPARIDGVSSRERVRKELAGIADRSVGGDLVMVVLIGHGSFQGDEARFNLPGPDMTPADFAEAIAPLAGRQIAFVNAASASGDFVKVLAGKDRVVVTATRSGMERNETVFGRYFVEAFTGEAADSDKDEQVSLLEAFDYARRETSRFYDEKKRLATEHALLEDDGDGVGVPQPGAETGDGALARRLKLALVSGGARAATADVAQGGVHAEKRALEARIEALKARKDKMEPEAYARELEALLLELARKSQAVREKDGPK